MKRRQYSLSRQIWLMMMTAAAIFALVFGIIIYGVITKEGQSGMLEQHRQIAAEPELLGWLDGQEDTIHCLVANTPEAWRDFQQMIQTQDCHGWHRSKNPLAGLELNETMQGFRFTGRQHTLWLITYLPESGQYLVSVFYPSLRHVAWPILGLTIIVVLLGIAHSVMVTRYVIRPIHQLALYAGDIAAKRWRPPMTSAKSAEEVGELIEAMNAMQSQLQSSEAEQQDFLQSISHDLKTPVAVIIGHAQAILDGVYVRSLEHNAAVIEEEARRLDNKIGKILYYNTLDYSLSNDCAEDYTAVDELLEDLAVRFGALAPHLKWQVQTQPADAAASEENLRVALENILDNALRYAKTAISLENSLQGDQLVVAIANDGDPIAPQRLERIFDQLSKDASGNFGLGLFISRKIITHYGGTITAKNMPGGVCFQVTLPKARRLK